MHLPLFFLFVYFDNASMLSVQLALWQLSQHINNKKLN